MNYIMQIKNRIYYLKLNYVPNLKGREFFFFFFFSHDKLCPFTKHFAGRSSPMSSAHSPVSCSSLTQAAHSLTKTSLSKFLFGLTRKFFLSSLVLKTTLLLGLTQFTNTSTVPRNKMKVFSNTEMSRSDLVNKKAKTAQKAFVWLFWLFVNQIRTALISVFKILSFYYEAQLKCL